MMIVIVVCTAIAFCGFVMVLRASSNWNQLLRPGRSGFVLGFLGEPRKRRKRRNNLGHKLINH